MNTKTILVTALTAGSLFAQAPEKELDARIQVFGEMIRPLAVTLSNGEKPEAQRSLGLGMRFMGEVSSAPNWYYEVGGKLDSSSNMTLANANVNLQDVKVTQSYWAVGTGYLVPMGKAFSLGFHLEGRGEALAAQGSVIVIVTSATGTSTSTTPLSVNTTYLRPWARVTLDGDFHLGSLRSFVGLELAGTPVKTSQTTPLANPSAMDNRTLRAMAPSVAAAFYLGMHL